MRSKLSLIAVACAVAVVAGCAAEKERDESLTGNVADLMPAEPAPSEAHEEAPQATVVLFADPHVVASLVTLQPGAELPDHRGEDRVAYATVGGTLQLGRDEGPEILELEQEQVVAFPDGPTTFANLGDSPLAFLLLSRSDVGLPELPDGVPPFEPERVANGAQPALESDAAVAYRLELEPGESHPVVGAPLWVLYAETEAGLAVRADDMDDIPLTLDAGDVHASTEWSTALENSGTGTARMLLVVYRSAGSA
jgi:quercetin dioxygenase-like cupin family protein